MLTEVLETLGAVSKVLLNRWVLALNPEILHHEKENRQKEAGVGLLGELLEKNKCDICANEIGLQGKHMLADGVLCQECVRKLSPFFSDYSTTTLDQVYVQLDYREHNKEAVRKFVPDRILGFGTKVLVDTDAGKFMVTSNKQWRSANPDVVDLRQVIGCDIVVKESRIDGEGKECCGSPQGEDDDDVHYDIYLSLRLCSPWFERIVFQVNDYRIGNRDSIQFREVNRQAEEIRDVLSLK